MARTYFQFILEYLTPEQKKEWGAFKMQKAAREHTDHFFGKGNNVIHEPLMNHTADKSEVHKAIERHLGQQIPHEDYKAGVATDKYGRKTKIGRLVKDQNLQKQFASDNTRAGSKTGSQFTMSIHRGTQVAGQTNPIPNKEHPKGHSWENQSCKNIEDGLHSESLEHEIKHGTVVAFAHDHTGKEVYRATLQPYTRADKTKESDIDDWENDKGYKSDNKHPRVYHVDAEYGVKKPEFTAHAHDIAKRLSAKAPIEENGKMVKYRVHHAVYDDKGRGETFHSDLNTSHIDKIVKSGSPQDKADIAEHPKLQPHHIEELEKQTRNEDTWAKHHDIHSPHAPKGEEESPGLLRISRQGFAQNIRQGLIKHPNTSADMLHHMINNPYKNTVAGKKLSKNWRFDEREQNVMNEISNIENIAEHGHNARKETLDYALKRAGEMRKSAGTGHLKDFVHTLHRYTLQNVIDHPNGGTEDHINHVLKHAEEGLKSKSSKEREGANRLAEHLGDHSKVRGDMLTRLINHKDSNIRSYAAKNPNLTPEHVDQIFKNKENQKNMPASSNTMHPIDQLLYNQHHHVTPEHIHIALKHQNHGIRVSALNHYKADLTHLEAAKQDKKNKQLVSGSIGRELEKRVKAGTQDKHRDDELKLIRGDDDDEDAW